MNILGISAFYHDSAACLINDSGIVAAAQEERFTRVKHDHSFPVNAVRYCLKEAGIGPAELDCVAFYEKPFVKFERILETYLQYCPKGLGSFLMSIPLWMRQKLWIPDVIRKETGYEGEIVFCEHHESHAASAFFPSPYSRAAFLTIDGAGEWATASYGVGYDNRVEVLSQLEFPHSLGLLYSAFTYYTGFKVNSGEYKMMGLAPYGRPKYVDIIYKHLVDLKEDGSMAMNMRYFDYCAGFTMTNHRFDRLFGGPPRAPESPLTQREMDIASSVQKVTEEIVLSMARHVRRETGETKLCLAGGVALNCVANGMLIRSGIFDDVWIQPAAGDAGGALGCAYIAHNHHLNSPAHEKKGRDLMRGSYLGSSYSDGEIRAFLDRSHIPYTCLQDDALVEETAKLLSGGNVVGWFQGRMEFGPRALGARSILGDPRDPQMQKRMNLKIKFRESFRPFAPSVLAEEAAKWFEIDRESPYMLLVAEIRKELCRHMSDEEQNLNGIDKLNVSRSAIPAVTHVDYTARVQSVNKTDNLRYHSLIASFNDRTGCPVLVNTSFNVRGEPIVESPQDAYRCFMRTQMDNLVMGNFILYKHNQPALRDDIEWRDRYGLD